MSSSHHPTPPPRKRFFVRPFDFSNTAVFEPVFAKVLRPEPACSAQQRCDRRPKTQSAPQTQRRGLQLGICVVRPSREVRAVAIHLGSERCARRRGHSAAGFPLSAPPPSPPPWRSQGPPRASFATRCVLLPKGRGPENGHSRAAGSASRPAPTAPSVRDRREQGLSSLASPTPPSRFRGGPPKLLCRSMQIQYPSAGFRYQLAILS